MKPAKPEAPVDITQALRDTESHMRALLSAGLTRKAVVVLICHETGLTQRVVEQVLTAATSLSKWTKAAGA